MAWCIQPDGCPMVMGMSSRKFWVWREGEVLIVGEQERERVTKKERVWTCQSPSEVFLNIIPIDIQELARGPIDPRPASTIPSVEWGLRLGYSRWFYQTLPVLCHGAAEKKEGGVCFR